MTRFIDDTFLRWIYSLDELEQFHEFLNSLHPKIKWTKQIEEDGSINFLDVHILRSKSNESFETTVYRKESASDRYIHFSSAQAWQEKVAAIRTLKHRAILYCSNNELLEAELSHLKKVFMENGFPENTVERILRENPKNNSIEMVKNGSEGIGTAKSFDYSKSFHAP